MIGHEEGLLAKRQFVQRTNTATVVLSIENARPDTFRISDSIELI